MKTTTRTRAGKLALILALGCAFLSAYAGSSGQQPSGTNYFGNTVGPKQGVFSTNVAPGVFSTNVAPGVTSSTKVAPGISNKPWP